MSPERMLSIDDLLAHAPFVRGLAAALVRGDDAVDDVVQETWVRALRAGPRIPGALRGWLARVVRSVAIDRRRRDAARRSREEEAARPERLPAVAEIVEREEARRAVLVALLRLAEPYRSALLWRYYHELTPREIADRACVPLETVRTRIRRGLGMLRDRLGAGPRRGNLAVALVTLAMPSRAHLAGGIAVKKALTVLGLVLAAALLLAVLHSFRPAPDAPRQEAHGQASSSPRAVDPDGAAPAARPPLAAALLVRGRAIAENGAPVAGARIEAGGCAVVTAANGGFGLALPAGGPEPALVRATAPGFVATELHLPGPQDDVVDAGDVVLAGAHELIVRVLTPGGRPVAEALVSWGVSPRAREAFDGGALWCPGRPHLGELERAGPTDEKGRCAIRVPAGAAVTVHVSHVDGRRAVAGPFLARGDAERVVELTDGHPLRFFGDDRGRPLRISVAREDDNPFAPFRLVVPYRAPETTLRLPQGRYEVRFWAGDTPLGTEHTVLTGPMQFEVPAARARVIDIELKDSAGRVPESARAYAYARMPDPTTAFFFVFRQPREIRQGSGQVTFDADPDKEARAALYIVAPGYKAIVEEVRWAENQEVARARGALEDGGRVEGSLIAPGSGEVELRLLRLDAIGKSAWAGDLAPLIDRARPGRDGRFVLRAVGTGRYAIRLAGCDLGEVQVTAGEVTPWEGAAPAGGVEVADAPLSGLSLLRLGETRGPLVEGTFIGSRLVFSRLPDGEYLLGPGLCLAPYMRAKGPGERGYLLPVDAATLSPSLRLLRVEGSVVRVTWDAGEPLVRRRIRVAWPPGIGPARGVIAVASGIEGDFPANLDWAPLAEDGSAEVAAPPGAGAVLVGLAINEFTERVRVLAVRPFARLDEFDELRVEAPATLEIVYDDARVLYVTLSRRDPFVSCWRLGRQGVQEGLLAGPWHVTVEGRDEKKGPMSTALDVTLAAGERRALRVSLPD